MKKYYHATNYDNLSSLITNGVRASMEGIVYLTESINDAIKFAAVRMLPKILVIEIEVPDDKLKNIVETFDHSYDFFKCRSYGYTGAIDKSMITDYMIYDNPLIGSVDR